MEQIEFKFNREQVSQFAQYIYFDIKQYIEEKKTEFEEFLENENNEILVKNNEKHKENR